MRDNELVGVKVIVADGEKEGDVGENVSDGLLDIDKDEIECEKEYVQLSDGEWVSVNNRDVDSEIDFVVENERVSEGVKEREVVLLVVADTDHETEFVAVEERLQLREECVGETLILGEVRD